MELFSLNPAELAMRRKAQEQLQDWRELRAFQTAKMATEEVRRQDEGRGPSEDEGQLISA